MAALTTPESMRPREPGNPLDRIVGAAVRYRAVCRAAGAFEDADRARHILKRHGIELYDQPMRHGLMTGWSRTETYV